jgi:UDP-N-acetylglucosamine--N-acetylmuramyl-(pentapeptide) pyrophosphoryl-undecaprenol N-acetylglucosamine transferase
MSDTNLQNRILLTGGHATPAVACIEELRKRGFTNLIYIGQKKSLLFDKNVSSEYRLITEQVKIPFKPIIAGKFSLFKNFQSLIWILRLPIGFIQALYFQVRYQPKLVLTFGSHVGVPVVFWAWVFKTPIIAHEQTVTFGRANKFIQKYATKVCYSWPDSAYSSNPKFNLTGNPIRKDIIESKSDKFKFADENKKIILIMGGNQGSHAINEFIFTNLEKILEKYNVIHQTGANSIFNDFGKAEGFVATLNKNGQKYIPSTYLFAEELGEAYKKSSIVISRGGANAITELIAFEKKSIIIPIISSSGNEQFLNGKLLEELGLGVVLNQDKLSEMNILEVLDEAENLNIKNQSKIAEFSNLHKNAEKKIIDILVSLF